MTNEDFCHEIKETIQKKETVVYCGPTIKDVVQKFAVFRGKIPQALAILAEELPAVANLIVPVSALSTVSRNLKKQASPENVFYNQILEHLKGAE